MNLAMVEKIVNAVLYEGYILYPYRASAVKNRQRFNFGAIYPESYSAAERGSEAWQMQTQCLAEAGPNARLEVKVRFLHLLAREVGNLTSAMAELPEDKEPEFRIVESLEIGDQIFQTWQEGVERDVNVSTINLNELMVEPRRFAFAFQSKRKLEPIRGANGLVAGVILRRQEFIEGAIDLTAEQIDDRLFKISARISNLTGLEGEKLSERDEALMRALVSTHTIFSIREGEFVSLLDPPDRYSEASASCQNIGTWPVMVGAEGERDLMLSSPIILYDYPQIAPESRGDLFDGTEIDEILTLRIMTLTDEEKREMRSVDERARLILERTESLPVEQMMNMHGAVRGLRRIKGDER